MRQQQTQVIQEPQQKHRGIGDMLSGLFDLVSTIFPNPVTPLISAGNKLVNHGDLSGVPGIVSGIMGGPSLSGGGGQNPNLSDPGVLPTQDQNSKSSTPVTDSVIQAVPKEPLKEEEDPMKSYQGKTLEELYTLHPELQAMFPLLIQEIKTGRSLNK